MTDHPGTIRTLQRWIAVLGAVLIVEGLALVSQQYHFAHANSTQNKCIADSFTRLTKTLTARGDLAAREAKSTQDVILGVAVSKTASDFERVLAKYQVAVSKTAAERRSHPYPPFPNGTCQ